MVRNLACVRMTGVRTKPGVLLRKAEAALATFQKAGEHRGTVDMLVLWAFALRHRGQADQALAQTDLAMTTARKIGYELGQYRLWYLRAFIHRERGQYEQAGGCIRHCLELAARLAVTMQDRTLALWELAGACHDPDSFPRATRMIEDGIRICEQRGEKLLRGYLLLALAELKLRFWQPDPRPLAEEAMAIFDDYSAAYGQVVGLRLLGQLRHADGDARGAVRMLDQALTLAVQLRSNHERAVTLTALGHARYGVGEPEAAHQAWRQAREFFARMSNTSSVSAISELLVQTWEPGGRLSEAPGPGSVPSAQWRD